MSGPASRPIRAAPAVPSRPWPRHLLAPDAWRAVLRALEAEPSLALLALWADTATVHTLWLDEATGAPLAASVPVAEGAYPAVSPFRPAACWFERAVHDLWGHAASGGRDLRPWLDHGRWTHRRPLAARALASAAVEPPGFRAAVGEDLHQIPVGPIHAGIIEPGHFRFTAAGETLVRLEVRLGYAHRGMLGLLAGKPPREAARHASRISGDSAVAHALAFARAVEAALGTEAPPRAHRLRAVMAELERVANHLGDFGAICNDAAFPYPLARAGQLRETVLRACAAAFGHRLMMDCVVPGGTAADLTPAAADAIGAALAAVAAALPELARLYDRHTGLNDRMAGTGTVSPALAGRYAAGGVIGRASGRSYDARRTPGYPPYDLFPPDVPTEAAGDVDARVRVRLAEIGASLRLLRDLLAALPEGPVAVAMPGWSGEGFGVAEGFRGDVWHWVRLDGGVLAAAYARDPSWLQWPLLEAAVRGNIVADFPLINKSFNCSYAGVDL